MESVKGKRLKEEFEQKVSKLETRSQAIEKEARDLAAELERQSSLLTDQVRKEKQDKFIALRDEMRTIDRQKKSVNDDLTMVVINDVQSIVKLLADNRGYAVVLNDGGPWLLYVSKSVDITDEVIKIYDQANAR